MQHPAAPGAAAAAACSAAAAAALRCKQPEATGALLGAAAEGSGYPTPACTAAAAATTIGSFAAVCCNEELRPAAAAPLRGPQEEAKAASLPSTLQQHFSQIETDVYGCVFQA